jgi:hypothetical protein
MIADLHIHTTASDGRLAPDDIIEHAMQANLRYIAITDHDTVDGLLYLNKRKRLTSTTTLTVIPGIELSSDLPQYEVHILGYYLDIFNKELYNQLDVIVADRHKRIYRMIEKLDALGYLIEYEQVMQLAGQSTSLGRPHIAKALVQKGYFSKESEVFTTLLYKNGPAYVPHYKLAPAEAIQLIGQAGGIAVLAHPGLIGNDSVILDLIQAGIRGIEVYHPKHDAIQIQKYLAIANQYKLAVTGGSDFHAIPTRFPEKLGIFTIPATLVTQLQHYRMPS